MNDTSCVISYNILGEEVMGYISHPKVLSSWMLGFLPYHAKWDEVLSNQLQTLHLKTSADFSAAHNNFFMLITVNKACSNYVVNAYVVFFIIFIDPWCITTSSFRGYSEVINKKVGNVCWVFQDAILVNYHTFAWVFLLHPNGPLSELFASS